jgi:hypothetical protein
MQIGGTLKKQRKTNIQELSWAVWYKEKESDDWNMDLDLSKYQAKLRAQSYANEGKIVEIQKMKVIKI